MDFFAEQKKQSKGTGCHLRDNSGNGCSGYIHMEQKDKNRVKDDVGNCANKHSHHSGNRESLTVDKIIQTGCHQCKKGSGSINGHISICIWESDLTGPEPDQKMIFHKKKAGCQYNGKSAQHQKRV